MERIVARAIAMAIEQGRGGGPAPLICRQRHLAAQHGMRVLHVAGAVAVRGDHHVCHCRDLNVALAGMMVVPGPGHDQRRHAAIAHLPDQKLLVDDADAGDAHAKPPVERIELRLRPYEGDRPDPWRQRRVELRRVESTVAADDQQNVPCRLRGNSRRQIAHAPDRRRKEVIGRRCCPFGKHPVRHVVHHATAAATVRP